MIQLPTWELSYHVFLLSYTKFYIVSFTLEQGLSIIIHFGIPPLLYSFIDTSTSMIHTYLIILHF